MSTFKAEVIRLGPITKHPNADSLSITKVFEQNCIFKTGTFEEGQLVVYIPEDSVVDLTREHFATFKKKPEDTSMRVKAIRLRGVYSEGILIPAPPGAVLGQDVATEVGAKKYEEPETRNPSGTFFGGISSPAKDPKVGPKYDMESFLKYHSAMVPGEDVVFTEKIHGCNARFVYTDKFHVGSHGVWRRGPQEGGFFSALRSGIEYLFNASGPLRIRFLKGFNTGKKPISADVWWTVAQRYDLENKLKQYPGLVLYGEVYGSVQDLKYSVPAEEMVRFVAFDIFDSAIGYFYSYEDMVGLCKQLDIPVAPEVHRGPLPSVEECKQIAAGDGKSVLDGQTLREGVVIRRVNELGRERAVFKLVNQAYKLRNKGTEFH